MTQNTTLDPTRSAQLDRIEQMLREILLKLNRLSGDREVAPMRSEPDNIVMRHTGIKT